MHTPPPHIQNLRLLGTSAADTLGNVANAGNDLLVGGAGADTLTGGAGADHFVYLSANDSTAASPDVIADFSSLQHDVIDLHGLTAGLAHHAHLTFIGTAAFSATDATGQVRFDTGTNTLEISTNADTTAEFQITLTGVAALTKADLHF